MQNRLRFGRRGRRFLRGDIRENSVRATQRRRDCVGAAWKDHCETCGHARTGGGLQEAHDERELIAALAVPSEAALPTRADRVKAQPTLECCRTPLPLAVLCVHFHEFAGQRALMRILSDAGLNLLAVPLRTCSELYQR
jgi:hypothetical protein